MNRRRPLADRGSPGRTHGNAVANPRIRVCSTVVLTALPPALRNRSIVALPGSVTGSACASKPLDNEHQSSWVSDSGLQPWWIGMGVLPCPDGCGDGRVGRVPFERRVRDWVVAHDFSNRAIAEIGQVAGTAPPRDVDLDGVEPKIAQHHHHHRASSRPAGRRRVCRGSRCRGGLIADVCGRFLACSLELVGPAAPATVRPHLGGSRRRLRVQGPRIEPNSRESIGAPDTPAAPTAGIRHPAASFAYAVAPDVGNALSQYRA